MVNQSDSSNKTMNSLSQMLRNIFSDNSNIMLAAIISLLLVILFVLLLHLYAKWFIFQAQARAQRRRRPRITTVTVSDVLGPARFHHFHSFNIEDSPLSSFNTKGLDSSIVAAIPMFMYKAAAEAEEQDYDDNDGHNVKHELECVICLSTFEDGEMGRAPIVIGFQVDSVGNVGEGDDSAFVEIVVDDSVVTPNSEIRESENGHESENDNAGVSGVSFLLFGCSLKGILSKVFSSSNVNELQASEP
ncbi:unnamed protein product [Lupinus luteus]|uniref:RING-type E3 ubiquitin transferase n=1 Tax=Lupinus luteus TaxID=3873 RepID=A0AAV1VXW1_LUPLU